MTNGKTARIILFIILLTAATGGANVAAQSGTPTRDDAPPQSGVAARAQLKLTPEEERLAQGSRAAVVATGISGAYFDEHFKLVRTVAATGDRRVVWKFSLNGYEATVSDSIGFYTDERGRRIDVHSVANTLAATRDIKKTVTRAEAEKAMRTCIGEFEGGSVIFAASGSPRRAALIFSATSVIKPVRLTARQKRLIEQDEKEERDRKAKEAAEGKPSPQSDPLRKGSRIAPPIVYAGLVDLETGKCTKGVARAGRPYPER